MMVVMLSSHGASWTLFTATGDKVFLVETRFPQDEQVAASMAEMVRECRWLFGNLRIIFMNRNDDWMEVIHDGAGHIKGYEPYDGPVPLEQEKSSDE